MRNGNVTVIAGLVSGAIVMFVLFQTILPALAQGRGSYELSWSTIDGGGGAITVGHIHLWALLVSRMPPTAEVVTTNY